MVKKLNFTPNFVVIGKVKRADRVGIRYYYDKENGYSYIRTLDRTAEEVLKFKYLLIQVDKKILTEVYYGIRTAVEKGTKKSTPGSDEVNASGESLFTW